MNKEVIISKEIDIFFLFLREKGRTNSWRDKKKGKRSDGKLRGSCTKNNISPPELSSKAGAPSKHRGRPRVASLAVAISTAGLLFPLFLFVR
jgi:hypothetical protein